MKKYRVTLLGVIGLILVLAYGVKVMEVLYGGDSVKLRPSLAQKLPGLIAGVKVVDLPLGPDEFVDVTAKEKMEYDDVINRSYADEKGFFAVYIGYWSRGKRSPSHVAAHIPDRCWTMAGMRCEESKTDYLLKAGGREIPGGQWRRFRDLNGNVLYVTFWHKVGNVLYDYGNTVHLYTSPWVRVERVIHDLFIWREDQYFFRIVSYQPLESLAMDPVFVAVMEKIEDLGLPAMSSH